MKPSYHPNVEGPDGWTNWIEPNRKDFRLGCCDCGLIHDLQFRLVSHSNGGKRIQFRVSRNNRSTAQHRRQKRKRGEQLSF